MLPKVAKVTVNAPVTLVDNGDTWTLDNGIVKITLAKRDGNLSSIVYHGVEILTHGNYSYWEQRPSGTITSRVTIDPATNGGERAEVSVKGVYNPNPSATAGGRGGGRGGMDLETRFTLERGTSGFYTYTEYTHHASYPTAGEGESRFILQDLNPTFDWRSVDKDRNQLESNAPEDHEVHAKEQSIYDSGIYKNSVEHKYSYNAPMYKLQAWGWSSTKDHIGVYFINPSNEYIMGGPERLDLIDHFSAPGSPAYQGDHPRLLDLRALRRGLDHQHPRRPGVEARRRPDLRLHERAGQPQGPLPGRAGQADGDLRQRHAGRAGGVA